MDGCTCDYAGKGTLEFADVVGEEMGYICEDFIGDCGAVIFGQPAEDGYSSLEVRSLNISRKPKGEAGAEARLNVADVARRLVRRYHYLLVVVVELVEGVKKLFLCSLGVGEELDVVYEEDVDRAIALLELVSSVVADRGYEVVDEGLAGNVLDFLVGKVPENRDTDSVEEVSLSEARATVQEEGVVDLSRLLGDSLGSVVREAVAVTHYEGVESVLG